MSIDTTSPSRSEMTVATLARAPGRSGSSTRRRYLLISPRCSAPVSWVLRRAERAMNPAAAGTTTTAPSTVLAAVIVPDPPGPLPFVPLREHLYTQEELTART